MNAIMSQITQTSLLPINFLEIQGTIQATSRMI